MAYNGSGTFLINTAGQPVVAGTVISSTTFNALTADLATGLSTVITKDGQTTVTANIPMATYKFTGLGVGSAAGDSANLSQVQSTVTKLLASVSGADTVTATASPTLAAYAAGQMFYFVAAGDNTTSVTLNIDALGAKAVTRDGSVALAAADIKSGEVVVVVYDGTRFQVVSQLNSAGNATFANVSITSALNVGGVATFSAGTAAAPSITTTGDTNTGLFFPAADTIAFTEGGVESMRIDSSANVGIGTSSPTNKLNVSGNGYLFALNGGLTNRVAQIFGNTGGGLDLGIEGSAGGTVFTSGSSYAGVIGTNNATVLQLGTNATIRATLDTSGNLGIGTTSPTTKLHINGTGGQYLRSFSTSNSVDSYFGSQTNEATVTVASNHPLTFVTNNTERARITSTGGLTVGNTSDPGAGNISANGDFRLSSNSYSRVADVDSGGGFGGGYNLLIDGTTAKHDSTGAISGYHYTSGGVVAFFTGASAVAGTTATERARITAAGELLLGATSQFNSGKQCIAFSGTAYYGISLKDTVDQTNARFIGFINSSETVIGSIDRVTTTNAVVYNTTSDYRLKTVLGAVANAGQRIDALQPVDYTWNDNGERARGFLAHQFQEVYASSVTGIKDAVNADGKPVYQAMQASTSEVIADLVAELQSLRKRVAELESK